MRPERLRWFAALVATAAALSLASACHKNSTSSPPDEAAGDQAGAGDQGAAGKPPPGPTGTITGKVTLTGAPPEMPLLQRGSDAVCARKEMHAETIVTGPGGALQNVLVRIKPGAVKSWVPSTPVVVNQVDCMYRPRVQGAVIGQMLVVKNSDQTAHNVHAALVPWGSRRETDTLFNRGQPAGSPDLKGPIQDDGVLALKCDQHGWMQGYVVASDSPYFATSNNSGTFTIENAPVGTYQLQAWHEFYGIKTQTVTVAPGKTSTVTFTYDADKDKPGAAGGDKSADAEGADAKGAAAKDDDAKGGAAKDADAKDADAKDQRK